MSTTPAFVGLIAVLILNEGLTPEIAAGIGFAVLGVLVMQLLGCATSSEGGLNPLARNTLVLGAGLGKALFTILEKAVTDRVILLEITISASVLGSLPFFPFAAYEVLSFD